MLNVVCVEDEMKKKLEEMYKMEEEFKKIFEIKKKFEEQNVDLMEQKNRIYIEF